MINHNIFAGLSLTVGPGFQLLKKVVFLQTDVNFKTKITSKHSVIRFIFQTVPSLQAAKKHETQLLFVGPCSITNTSKRFRRRIVVKSLLKQLTYAYYKR